VARLNAKTGRHEWYDADHTAELPFRKLFREKAARACDGFVPLDLDLIVLRFGALLGRNPKADGEFYLAEMKTGNAQIKYSQQRVLALLTWCAQEGDPTGRYFKGSFVINWHDDHVVVTPFEVAQRPMPGPEHLTVTTGTLKTPVTMSHEAFVMWSEGKATLADVAVRHG